MAGSLIYIYWALWSCDWQFDILAMLGFVVCGWQSDIYVGLCGHVTGSLI